MSEEASEQETRLLHRLLFFSDAVFAIVLTLLVLELRPPEHAGGASLGQLFEMGSHLGAFALTFAVTGIFWMAHMQSLRRLTRFDWPVAVANLVFLFAVCLLPFVSAWLGESFDDPFTWGLYCTLLVLTSAGSVGLVLTIWRGGGRLTAGGVPGEGAVRVARAASPGAAFLIGLGLVAAGWLRLAQFCWVLIPLFMLAANRLAPRAAAPQADAASEGA